MSNTELIARSKKVAAELDDFNSSLDRKAGKCIRDLLNALQSAQPEGGNQGGNCCLPPLQPVAAWTDGNGYVTTSKTIAEHHAANGEPMAPLAAPGCKYCNHPLFAGRQCKKCGRVAQPAPEKAREE